MCNRLLTDAVGAFGGGVDATINKLENAFDARGLRTRAASYNTVGGAVANEVAWEYNKFNQPVAEYQEHWGAVDTGTSPKVQFSYASGAANRIRQTGVTSPNGTAVAIGYGTAMADALNRADALKEGVAKLASFRYLGHDLPVNLKYDAASDAEWTLRNGGVMSACDAQAGGEDGGTYTGLDGPRGELPLGEEHPVARHRYSSRLKWMQTMKL